jgi:hypothetical protein
MGMLSSCWNSLHHKLFKIKAMNQTLSVNAKGLYHGFKNVGLKSAKVLAISLLLTSTTF